MIRRDFVLALAAIVAAAGRSVRGQRASWETVGFLHAGSSGGSAALARAFEHGLSEAGFVRDRNVGIEYRWANGQDDRLPGMANDLIQRGVAVIAVAGNPAARLSAKAATATVPIVFVSGSDPVKEGLVASLNRPGANVTGVSILTTALDGKRFDILREMVPDADPIAILADPQERRSQAQLAEVHATAQALGKQVLVLNARNEREIDSAFAKATQLRAGALLVLANVGFFSRRDQVVGLAARHAIPAIYEWREFCEIGGLMSYGASITAGYRQMGAYVARLLKGARPADLPVVQSAKFELVINLKTAIALGIKVPPAVLLRADDVIR